MRYIYLKEIKQHLYIDFTADDVLLADMITAAEDIVEKYLNRNLSDLEDTDGNLPAPVRMAIKVMTGNLYNNRESTSFNATPHKLPYTYEYLLQPYKKYGLEEETTETNTETEAS